MTTMAGLYVEFKAKSEEIDKAFNKLNREFNELKNKQARAASGFTNMANKIGTAIKVLAGAFIFREIFQGFDNVIDKINESQEAIDRLTDSARSLGVVASDLQKMSVAAKLSGVEFGSLEMLIKKTNISISTAADGNEELTKSFKDLGLSVGDLKSLSPDEQLRTIIEALSNVSDKTKQNGAAFNIFGKSMAEALNLARDGFTENLGLAEKLGIVLTRSQREAVDAFGDARDKISTIWGGLWEKITAYVAPAFSGILENLVTLIEKFGGIDTVAQKFAQSIVSGVATALDALNGIVNFIDSLYARMLKLQIFALETANKADKFNVGQAVGEYTGVLQEGSGAERQYGRTQRIGQLSQELGQVEKTIEGRKDIFKPLADAARKAGDDITKVPKVWEVAVSSAADMLQSGTSKLNSALSTTTDALVTAATKLSNTTLGDTLGLNKDAPSSDALDQNIKNIYMMALKGSKPEYVTTLDENGNTQEVKNTYDRMIEALNKQAVSTFQNDPAGLTKYLDAINQLKDFTKNIDPKDQKISVDINVTADAGLKASVATSSEVANAIIATVSDTLAKAASRGAR